ncbi:ester cyclase [Yeosuana sp. MJ-SS3]|uniref:Ester cyclase n=1 Tax=Gilvirhabdus luticola TaxID=3079858 RepID=A0ABU3U748_9FLAO|nr:ester cyclase [Yeosuana sp. MJ-SS3]MDU8886228.1 ester cyclase [Yeosuana sp. MJ-SS3]
MKTKVLTIVCITLLGFMSCNDASIELAQQNKEIVTKAFEVVGNGDYDKFDLYIAKNYVRHSQATPDLVVNSLDDFKAFIRQDRQVIPDQHLEIKKLVAEGDLVAFYAVYKGTQTGQMGPFPPSNKFAELDFSGVHRMENGKIVETWITWDNLTILKQLGHFPPAQE